MNVRRFLLLAVLLTPALAFAAEETHGEAGKKKDDKTPENVSLSDTAEAAMKKFSVAPGLQVSVWAEEPLLANPVAFAFDEKGRAFVAETYRRRTSVPDIRKHENLVLENLALRSVDDRMKFIAAKFPTDAKMRPTLSLQDFNADGQFDYRDWGVEAERVKLLTDTKGTGRADTATVFATLPTTPVSGLGAGVAAFRGQVFHTCAPDLWRHSAEEGGKATASESVLNGFAVHVVFGGHDMHGVKFGPDGRLYWTIADCGARVATKEGAVLDCPDSGAVFRSELDGTGAELVAIGLRNPQSLAWNDVGDLFTGDNNADGGDKARWTHIVDGGDYGWRLGWQFLNEPKLLGPWNTEGMWHLDVDKRHFAVLPPVGHIGHGPAGIAYYPGTGLPEQYREHFFYADFPGGVRAFKLTPRGASYTVENPGDVLQDNSQKNLTGKLLWGLFPSDVQFGPNGGAYVLDWVQGWEKTGKGRIYRVHDPKVDASPIVQETTKLLAEEMAQRRAEELLGLLGHADQRVRLAAQYELALGAEDRRAQLLGVARSGKGLAQRHAIWGLGQAEREAARKQREKVGYLVRELVPLLDADDVEVRAQAARVCGEHRVASAKPYLLRRLKDSSPRVRFFAAQALGKIGGKEVPAALAALLRENADTDAFIRHAAVVSLAQTADAATITKLAAKAPDSVRIGALLALRRQADPAVGAFLKDANPAIVAEAARAVHDGPLPIAWPQLASLAGLPGQSDPIARRAVNANFLLGTTASAQRLAKIAGDATAAAPVRLDAITSLAIWNAPFHRNRVNGLWQALPVRDAAAALSAIAPGLPALFKDANADVRLAAVELAGTLQARVVEPQLVAFVGDATLDGKTRSTALRSLDAIGSAQLGDAVKTALAAKDKTLAEAGRKLAGKVSPQLAVQVNAPILGKGKIREQQEALATIAAQPVPEADKVLLTQFDALAAGQLPKGLWLDLFEAAAKRDHAEVKQRLAARTQQVTADPSLKWSECLEGGDAKVGKTIFAEKAEAACMRCHKVKGQGGDVGPELAGLGKKHDRAYILQAIVDPSATIAPGYENVVLTMKDGAMVTGLLNAETDQELTVASLTDGKKQSVKKADVKDRMKVPSAMPPGLGEVLGARDLRDLVEYLATLK